MQAFVFDKLSTNNQSAVFPPLLGSHRKIKIIQVNSTPSPKVQLPPRELEEEENFLERMKKAREVILSHQKRNKVIAATNQKRHKTEKSESQVEVLKGKKKQSFSQVVYNINSHMGKSKKLNQYKKQSIDSNRFNDKVLRQCKSQFMPNFKDKPKHRNKFFSNKKHHTDRDDKIETPKNFSPNVELNPQLNFQSLRKYKSKLIFSRRFNMKDFFNDQLLDSNGSQLIQKLKKCLNDRVKDEKSTESIVQDEIKQQINVEETKQTVQENQKQCIPFANLKMGKKTQKLKKNRVKMNFFVSNKKNLNEKLLLQIQEKMRPEKKEEVINLRNTQPLSEVSSMKQSELERYSNQKQNIESDKQRTKDQVQYTVKQKLVEKKQPVHLRRNEEKKGIASKYRFDENFKVQGWVNEPNIQFQVY